MTEICNFLLCATLGLTPDFEQSGTYIEGWLRAMKEDTRAVFRAASEAEKATALILTLGCKKQMANVARGMVGKRLRYNDLIADNGRSSGARPVSVRE